MEDENRLTLIEARLNFIDKTLGVILDNQHKEHYRLDQYVRNLETIKRDVGVYKKAVQALNEELQDSYIDEEIE